MRPDGLRRKRRNAGFFSIRGHGFRVLVCTCCMQFSRFGVRTPQKPANSRAQAWFSPSLYALVCVVCICLKREMAKKGRTAKTTAYTAYKREKCRLSPTLHWHSAIWGENAYKVHTGAYEMHTTPFSMPYREGNVNGGASLPVLDSPSPGCRASVRFDVSPQIFRWAAKTTSRPFAARPSTDGREGQDGHGRNGSRTPAARHPRGRGEIVRSACPFVDGPAAMRRARFGAPVDDGPCGHAPTGIFTFGGHENGAPVCTFCMQLARKRTAYGQKPANSRAERRFRAWLYALVCVVCICLKRKMPKIRPTPKTTAYTAYKT